MRRSIFNFAASRCGETTPERFDETLSFTLVVVVEELGGAILITAGPSSWREGRPLTRRDGRRPEFMMKGFLWARLFGKCAG
jgi:hypothetical protein